MHGARNLNPVITLKNLLPPDRGPMLRDGPALAIPDRDGETGPATRLLRKQHRNAAINLRNLIMPVDGGRSGGGQERVNLQEDPASPQGQPGWGIVPQQPNLPYLLDRERHTGP